MKRHSNLNSRLEKLELEVSSLDNDSKLSQSSARVHDDISCASQPSRRQLAYKRLSTVSQNSTKNDMTLKNTARVVSPSSTPKTGENIVFSSARRI